MVRGANQEGNPETASRRKSQRNPDRFLSVRYDERDGGSGEGTDSSPSDQEHLVLDRDRVEASRPYMFPAFGRVILASDHS